MRTLTTLILVLTTCIMAGCGTCRFMKEDPAPCRKPEPGKALVQFHRPSSFGFAVEVALFDKGGRYIGAIDGSSGISYQCEPGKQIFVGDSEIWSVVDADLAADRIYDIVCEVHMGVFKARIWLVPVTQDDKRRKELPKWIADEKWYTVDREKYAQEIQAFEEKGKQKISETAEDFLSGKHKNDLKVLHADDGITYESKEKNVATDIK